MVTRYSNVFHFFFKFLYPKINLMINILSKIQLFSFNYFKGMLSNLIIFLFKDTLDEGHKCEKPGQI